MGNRYFELRVPHSLKMVVGNDIAAHIYARQFLGSTIVVCEHPFAMLSVVRKAWHKMIRKTQNERARTLNAEEVLRLTRRSIQMQQLRFTSSHPDDSPCADVYFVTPDMLTSLPSGCYTIYLTCKVSSEQLTHWIEPLLSNALVVNYDVGVDMRAFGCLPKRELEKALLDEWHTVVEYLQKHDIALTQLDPDQGSDPELNEVLDILLNSPKEFIELTTSFQHQMDITQPLRDIPDTTQARMATILRLAHRVQALAPSNHHLKKIFGNTDTFFLRDRSSERLAIPGLLLEACR